MDEDTTLDPAAVTDDETTAEGEDETAVPPTVDETAEEVTE